jgi:hypothetical protein
MADPRDEIRIRYPKTIKEFETIQKEMLYLFCEKQLDYGPTNIGLGNSKVEKDKDVQLSCIGLGTRLNDKISRFLNLMMHNKEPNNESIEDTLIDIANYAVMALIVRSKLWGK